MDGKHLIRFQSENAAFKLLQRSVDEKHLIYVFRVKQCGRDVRKIIGWENDHVLDPDSLRKARTSGVWINLRWKFRCLSWIA